MRFEFRGKIRGQGRPRFTRRGHAYEKPEDKEYKAALRAAYLAQGGKFYGDQPIRVKIETRRALPKSKARKTREVSEPDTFKPDADNIGKAVLDALNGVAFADDKQIVRLEITKCSREFRECDEMTVTVEPI